MALVLVVEDDSILAYVLERVLTKAGHDVIGTAASFAKAVSIAASCLRNSHWSISISAARRMGRWLPTA